MIQCALNGAYSRDDHPAVPVTLEQLVADAVDCRAAGARSVHLHPRRPVDGLESLAAEVHDPVVSAIRAAVPDLEISCSTQEDIDLGDATDRIAAVRAWTQPPDVVSVNLAEPGAVELGAALLEHGIGIEAGVFTLAGADTLLAAPGPPRSTVFSSRRSSSTTPLRRSLWRGQSTRASPSCGVLGSGTATPVPPGRSSTPGWARASTCASDSRTRSSAATAGRRRPTPPKWPTRVPGQPDSRVPRSLGAKGPLRW